MQLKSILVNDCNANVERVTYVENALDEQYPTLIDAAIMSLHSGEHNNKSIAVLSHELVSYVQVPPRKFKRALQATKYCLMNVHESTWTLVAHD